MSQKLVKHKKLLFAAIVIILALVLVRGYSITLSPAEARTHTFRDLLLSKEGQTVPIMFGGIVEVVKVVEVRGDYVVIELRGQRSFITLAWINAMVDTQPSE